ncbi:MAG: cytochrome c biogenesis CcdA family protein [Candidatus Bipolaricaulia bacterium]
MDLGLLSFAFVAGMAAFFNPCGFAMLPSYVSHYIGREGGADRNWFTSLVKGLRLGGTVSSGFFTIFVGLGLIVSALGSIIARYIPWVASVIGVGLVILGVLMILSDAPRTKVRGFSFHRRNLLSQRFTPPRWPRPASSHTTF